MITSSDLKQLLAISVHCRTEDGSARSDLVLEKFPELYRELCMHREFWNCDRFDGTDGAHPAWWRGHDDTVASITKQINKILDGEAADRSPNSTQPYHRLCRRIYRMAAALRDIKAVVDTTEDAQLALNLVKAILEPRNGTPV
jgi:hypothetical protein